MTNTFERMRSAYYSGDVRTVWENSPEGKEVVVGVLQKAKNRLERRLKAYTEDVQNHPKPDDERIKELWATAEEEIQLLLKRFLEGEFDDGYTCSWARDNDDVQDIMIGFWDGVAELKDKTIPQAQINTVKNQIKKIEQMITDKRIDYTMLGYLFSKEDEELILHDMKIRYEEARRVFFEKLQESKSPELKRAEQAWGEYELAKTEYDQAKELYKDDRHWAVKAWEISMRKLNSRMLTILKENPDNKVLTHFADMAVLVIKTQYDSSTLSQPTRSDILSSTLTLWKDLIKAEEDARAVWVSDHGDVPWEEYWTAALVSFGNIPNYGPDYKEARAAFVDAWWTLKEAIAGLTFEESEYTGYSARLSKEQE